MGIPGLVKCVFRKYPKSYKIAKPGEDYDHLYLDFNSIIYDSLYKVLAKSPPNSQIEGKIVAQVIATTSNLINVIVQPRKSCYIAIDGPAPRAKMVEQRERRYKSVYLKLFKDNLRKTYPEVPRSVWDRNKISPGTPFMERLDKALKGAIQKGEFQKHPKADNLEILFNGYRGPGEAEHKYMPAIAENPDSDKIAIYSPDADVFMLGARYPTKNIDIMRPVETVKFFLPDEVLESADLENDYVLIDITYVDNEIHQSLGPTKDKTQVMKDYILFSMIGGNDFVRPFLFTSIADKGVDDLFNKIYRTVSAKYDKPLVDDTTDPGKALLNINFFADFVGELAKIELQSLQKKQKEWSNPEPWKKRGKDNKNMPKWKQILEDFEKTPVYKKTNPMYEKYSYQFREINFFDKNWKQQYYKTLFEKGITVKEICLEWVKSIVFAINYYLVELPSWTYFYPFHVAPLPSDVREFLLSDNPIDELITFSLGKPVSTTTQLMMILPPENKILPKKYNDLMKKSPLKPFYPPASSIELNYIAGGGKYIYARAELPTIDTDILQKELKKIGSNTNNSRNRNRNSINRNRNGDRNIKNGNKNSKNGNNNRKNGNNSKNGTKNGNKNGNNSKNGNKNGNNSKNEIKNGNGN